MPLRNEKEEEKMTDGEEASSEEEDGEAEGEDSSEEEDGEAEEEESSEEEESDSEEEEGANESGKAEMNKKGDSEESGVESDGEEAQEEGVDDVKTEPDVMRLDVESGNSLKLEKEEPAPVSCQQMKPMNKVSTVQYFMHRYLEHSDFHDANCIRIICTV